MSGARAWGSILALLVGLGSVAYAQPTGRPESGGGRPPASTAPLKVAVPAFSLVGIESAVADVYSDHFVTLLGRDGRLKLTTQRDIGQVLGLERQKQLLGCGETQSSCLAELAGALGVDAILSVSLAKRGESFTATVRVLNATDGTEVAAATQRLKSEDALQDWLDEQAPLLAAKVLAAFGRTQKPVGQVEGAAGRSSSVLRWVPAIGGAALAVAGGALFAVSRGNAEQLRTGRIESLEAVHSVSSAGRTFEGAGVGLMVTGGLAIAASAVWVWVGPAGGPQVAIVPSLGGGGAVVRGEF